jgi:hypothetical protein
MSFATPKDLLCSSRPVRLDYQPPADIILLSEQISINHQPVSSIFSLRIIQHKPPAGRTDRMSLLPQPPPHRSSQKIVVVLLSATVVAEASRSVTITPSIQLPSSSYHLCNPQRPSLALPPPVLPFLNPTALSL